MYEYELEALAEPEAEGEFENEFEEESELEAEAEEEAEAFFSRLAKLARRAMSSPALRRVGQVAAQAALAGVQPQAEYEEETEFEAESILSPIRRVYPDALMEHFGHAAAEAESEVEAEALVSALVPLARRAVTTIPRPPRSLTGTAAARTSPALPRLAPRGTSAGERPVRRESQERRGAPLTERVRKPFGWVGPAASRCGRLVKVGRVGW
jgi:hypothetical protein